MHREWVRRQRSDRRWGIVGGQRECRRWVGGSWPRITRRCPVPRRSKTRHHTLRRAPSRPRCDRNKRSHCMRPSVALVHCFSKAVPALLFNLVLLPDQPSTHVALSEPTNGRQPKLAQVIPPTAHLPLFCAGLRVHRPSKYRRQTVSIAHVCGGVECGILGRVRVLPQWNLLIVLPNPLHASCRV